MRSLTTALSAVRKREWDKALAAVLEAWAQLPQPAITDLVLAISTRAAPRALTASWVKAARGGDPADIPLLLDTLVAVKSAEAIDRITQLPRTADPRIDAAMIHLLETLPFQSQKTRPFWREVFDRVRCIRDPRHIEALALLDQRIRNNTPPTTAAWMCSQLAKARAEIEPTPTAPVPPIVDDILRALEAEPTRDLATLLAAVYANPDDDAPRLVYADALQEVGDPHGELIVMQLATQRDLAREKAFLARSGRKLLGELAPVILAGFTFERGFLATCTVDIRKRDQLERLCSHAAWSTVRAIKLGGAHRGTIPLDELRAKARRLLAKAPGTRTIT